MKGAKHRLLRGIERDLLELAPDRSALDALDLAPRVARTFRSEQPLI